MSKEQWSKRHAAGILALKRARRTMNPARAKCEVTPMEGLNIGAEGSNPPSLQTRYA